MATEGLKQQTIKKRKQDDITVNITVNGLNSSSDHTSQQLHIRVFAKMLHTPYLTCENVLMNSLEKRIFNSSGFTHLEKKLTKIVKSKFDSVAFVS